MTAVVTYKVLNKFVGLSLLILIRWTFYVSLLFLMCETENLHWQLCWLLMWAVSYFPVACFLYKKTACGCPTENKFILMQFLFIRINSLFCLHYQKNNWYLSFINHTVQTNLWPLLLVCLLLRSFEQRKLFLLFTYCRLTRVCYLTVALPSPLMGQSSRWLFLGHDEMEKPGLASEKSLAINLSSERFSCSLGLWQYGALAL